MSAFLCDPAVVPPPTPAPSHTLPHVIPIPKHRSCRLTTPPFSYHSTLFECRAAYRSCPDYTPVPPPSGAIGSAHPHPTIAATATPSPFGSFGSPARTMPFSSPSQGGRQSRKWPHRVLAAPFWLISAMFRPSNRPRLRRRCCHCCRHAPARSQTLDRHALHWAILPHPRPPALLPQQTVWVCSGKQRVNKRI